MSARTQSRIARMLAMIPYVVEHGGASLADLRERFDYPSDKAVVKDLNVIFMTGLPGYGPGDLIDVDIFEDEVVIESADHFRSALRLTPGEALGLLAAGSTLVASGQAPPALASAVDKLATAIGVELDDQVILDVPTPQIVHDLRYALESHNPVRIVYVAASTNETTTRVVEGEAVFFNLGAWYFRGYCRLADDDRLFRVDRIASVEVLDEEFVPVAADSPAVAIYEPSPDDHIAVFDVGPTSRWVADYYPVESEQLTDGVVRITMHVADPLVAARLLLQLGDDATLVEGTAVDEALHDLRDRILEAYATI